ncbi:hypothetical protein QE152_g25797 [Popillia japonica]|uniref:Uncharacterized protein n=1 Tax=Popillia japonica TaxID=7064 RepID=A0AAW1JZW3_POPJA
MELFHCSRIVQLQSIQANPPVTYTQYPISIQLHRNRTGTCPPRRQLPVWGKVNSLSVVSEDHKSFVSPQTRWSVQNFVFLAIRIRERGEKNYGREGSDPDPFEDSDWEPDKICKWNRWRTQELENGIVFD